jgi:hypothetical protein
MAGRYSLFASAIGVKLASDDDRQTAARELVDHRQHSEGTPIPASGLADNRCRRRSLVIADHRLPALYRTQLTDHGGI